MHDQLCPYEIGGDECHCRSIAKARDDVLADLRAKAEALPTFTDADLIGHLVWRSDVLALLDGSSE